MSDRCKERVWSAGAIGSHRCYRKAVKDGYCKQHHPDAVAKRRDESMARWKAENERDKAKRAQEWRQREDGERFAALCAKPDLFQEAWRLWDGESDFRIAFDKAMEVQP